MECRGRGAQLHRWIRCVAILLQPQRYQDYLSHGDPLAHHGPAYFMLFALVARAGVLNPAWHIATAGI